MHLLEKQVLGVAKDGTYATHGTYLASLTSPIGPIGPRSRGRNRTRYANMPQASPGSWILVPGSSLITVSLITDHLAPRHLPRSPFLKCATIFCLSRCPRFVQGRLMGSENEPDRSGQDGITLGSVILASVPFLALIIGPFVANRLEPRICGLPFLLAYCVFWVLITPVFLFCVDRLRKR